MDATKLMSLMKQKKAALQQKAKTIKPKDGANRYVILQGWRKGEEQVFFHDFGQHYVKNAAGEIQAVYVCADKTFGNPCPVCAGIQAAIRTTSDDETANLLKEAASGQSYLLNVLALDSDDAATPQILEVRKTVFGQIVDLIEEWGATVFDPSEPQIVTVNRSGKGLNTKYSVQISPKKHAMPAGVFAKLNNLDDYVRQESEEGQRRAIAAINSVAGLLPAPGTGGDKPRTTPSSIAGAGESMEARSTAKVVSKPGASDDLALDDELEALLAANAD